MAIAVVQDFAGATLDQYDQVISKMGLESGGAGPDGLMFHWAAATPEGVLITDVWETLGQFQEWAQEKTGPLAAEAGITDQPKVTVHELHGYLTAG